MEFLEFLEGMGAQIVSVTVIEQNYLGMPIGVLIHESGQKFVTYSRLVGIDPAGEPQMFQACLN